MAVDAVIFDWGGTLTPWHTIDLREQWAAYTRVREPARADELAGLLLEAETAAWTAAREHQRSGTIDDLFRSVGLEPSGELHERALAAYHEFWTPHTLIDPEAPPLLAALRERSIKVGVLSNTLWSREYHEEVFRRDGVLGLVDGAVYSSEIPYTKPHPEAFHAAMRAVGVEDPTRVVFVGDRPYDDVAGAKAFGMRAVLRPNRFVDDYDVEPDAVIDRLPELLPLVDRWRSGGV